MLNHAEILIVDDHEAIRTGIRSLLRSRPQWHVCGEAVDGVDAVEKAKVLHPDVVLMDVSMPRMDGIAATRMVRREAPGSRVIIVTQNDAALNARRENVQADGYVLKVHMHRDLVPTIERVLGSGHTGSGATTIALPATQPEPGSPDLRDLQPQSSGLLAAIVNSSDDAVVSKDLNGIVMSWNRGAERLFGYVAAEMIGQSIRRIIPDERRTEEDDILARVRHGESVDHFETERVRKDGTRVDVSVTISPVRDARGRIIGASKIARDITQKKESERELVTRAGDLESTVQGHSRELEQRSAEILEQAEQLQELSSRLQQGQDEERRRIARELHDSAGQLLAVLSLNLGQARARVTDDETARALDDSEQIVEQLNREIRTLSYLLHPPLLDEAGLSGAIHWYARGLAERASFELAVDVPDDFGRLPSDMEVALFRIIQECLTNIHRHAGARTATIRLACENHVVRLEVQDDGGGIPSATQACLHRHCTGVGIAGIRERVRHFGGDMRIESTDGGTTVSVTLPVPGDFDCNPDHDSAA